MRNSLTQEVEALKETVFAGIAHQYQPDEIFALIDEHPPATLQSTLERINTEIEQLQIEQDELHEQRGELSQQIKHLAEGDELEVARLELKEVEAQIATAQQQWQELAATSLILESLREFYETHRQPETLRAASDYLKEMTGGRYTRLWTRMVGNALLVDSADEHGLSIEVLSRGTREAVFLSLRLALVAAYRKRGVNLPMVLDDVLVNFDAERARWAAEVLKKFAHRSPTPDVHLSSTHGRNARTTGERRSCLALSP